MPRLADITTFAGSLNKDTAKKFGERIVQRAENRAIGYIDSKIQQGIDYLFSKIPGNLLSLFYAHEDFNRLRLINHQLVQIDFVKEWNFSISIDGAPLDLDFYIKDITYGLLDSNNDETQVGSVAFSWPTNQNSTRISLNMRDNEDLRCFNFMRSWYEKVFPGGFDGTVGLPYGEGGYLRRVTIKDLDIEGIPTQVFSGLCYPSQCGECSRSHENGNFMEFPVTLINFSSYA